MRKEYDFSGGHRGRPNGLRAASGGHEPPPLTQAQVRELRRRVADSEDPTRFLIVSGLTPSFQLYYNAEADAYVLNEPREGTLFKSRRVARAVAAALGPRTRVAACRSRVRHGKHELVRSSVPVVARGKGRRLTRA